MSAPEPEGRLPVFAGFGGDDEPVFVEGARLAVPVVRDRLLAASPTVPDRPLVVAVDGRSASGKTTLAARLAQAPGWCVVATDDAAWWHSFFDWDAMLRDEVLAPARAGRAVSFTPPAWRERGREGAIEVPAGTRVLLVEGVGSSRRSLTDHLDAAVWVHTPLAEVERREAERIRTGHVDAGLQHDWMTAELAFLADDRPWERADLVVSGTDLDTEAVVLLQEADR
ncbi:uridine kinase family protein [Piscicoccus intestinalis]|uniref:uridine kinase family protein n=1 Tax=Piscicoccus intestinalis TaxID=746033 RepID=UPI000A001653|nr:AAA family ATPase [Piscicoccus intestinalis]